MSRKRTFDWEAARAKFVSSDMTCGDVARELGCAEQSVRRMASVHRWTEARKNLRRQLTVKADRQLVESRASQLKDSNEVDFKGASSARGLILKKLNRLIKTSNEEHTEDLPAINSLLHALETAQRVCRLALGATTSNEGAINDPTEDGTSKPSLNDFYKTVKFEGPAEPAATDTKDPTDAGPETKH